MRLHGFHHLTAITANVGGNRAFYTQTLGMRLVKKTVNQDDTSAYHLFYADGRASPGTDVTFFDWPMTREKRGTHSIVRTGLRVASASSLPFWIDRLRTAGVPHLGEIVERAGRIVLDFEDPERQRLSIVVDGGRGPGEPWERGPVPAEHQIRGLGPICISVPAIERTEAVLTQFMNMRRTGEYTLAATDGSDGSSVAVVFTTAEANDAGPAAELHVAIEPALPAARQGAGGVHHVAFRVPTFAEYDAWADRLREFGVASSGPVDRFYFKSLYFREPNGILFELATDGPGFAADEPMESLGEHLSLPPFLESQRTQIEAGLKPV